MRKITILVVLSLVAMTSYACNGETVATPDTVVTGKDFPNHNYYDDENSIEFSMHDVVDVVRVNGNWYIEIDLYNDDYMRIGFADYRDVKYFMAWYDYYNSGNVAEEWSDTYGETDLFYATEITKDYIYHAKFIAPYPNKVPPKK